MRDLPILVLLMGLQSVRKCISLAIGFVNELRECRHLELTMACCNSAEASPTYVVQEVQRVKKALWRFVRKGCTVAER